MAIAEDINSEQKEAWILPPPNETGSLVRKRHSNTIIALMMFYKIATYPYDTDPRECWQVLWQTLSATALLFLALPGSFHG